MVSRNEIDPQLMQLAQGEFLRAHTVDDKWVGRILNMIPLFLHSPLFHWYPW
jgi:hypothetical protein